MARTDPYRPELKKAIDQLGTGDVLVLSEWDRCTRSMTDGIAIIERVHKHGASVKGPRPRLPRSHQAHQPWILAFLSALAEDERHRILKRANDAPPPRPKARGSAASPS